MAENRVIVVSTATKQTPLMALVTATENALHINSIEKLPSNLVSLTTRMAALKVKAFKLDAELVIEDHSGMFRSFGRAIRIDGQHADSRPVLVAAMERYKALSTVNAITYPDGLMTSLKITTNIYNLKHNDRGEISYLIDWDSLTDERRIFLLSVYAAMCQTVFQAGFLERVLGASDEDKPLKSLESEPNPSVNRGNGGRTLTL